MESEIITNNGYLTAWIGLNDRFEEGQWTWADGSKCVTSDGSCSQFLLNPSNKDLFGNFNADCILLANYGNIHSSIMNPMLCDEVVMGMYAVGYLCNDDLLVSNGAVNISFGIALWILFIALVFQELY
eukprot:232055_1